MHPYCIGPGHCPTELQAARTQDIRTHTPARVCACVLLAVAYMQLNFVKGSGQEEEGRVML
jgi:hypothetical protein